MSYYPPGQNLPAKQPRRQPAPAGRDRTWLWALLTLAILSLCTVIALIVIAAGGQLPDLTPRPAWTPPPTLAVTPGNPPQPADVRVQVGDLVSNASGGGVNLRRTPGYQNKPASDVLTVVRSGATGAIVDGPQPADGLTWWLARFDGQEGWIAEQTDSGLLLLAPAP